MARVRTRPQRHVTPPIALAEALSRVGRTPEDQARWLLTLAYSDSVAGESGGWSSVQHEIAAFLHLDPEDYLGYGQRIDSAVPQEAAEECMKALRQGLRDLTTEGKWLIDMPRTSFIARWWDHYPFRCSLSLPFIWQPIDARTRRRGWGFGQTKLDWRGYFLMRVSEVLRQIQQKFRVCRKRDCRRAFIATRRQEYCTVSCSQSIRTRRYRTSHRQTVNRARRTSYKAAIKKAHGSHVKVKSRHSI